MFVETGNWLRAQWLPEARRDRLARVGDARGHGDARARSASATSRPSARSTCRDRTPATFLDRVYANTFSTLPVGKARYGLMLREDGFALDDGTTARLAEDHYFMTTTTANAVKVMQHLEFCHQCIWPELDVQMVSVTEQWAQYAIAGPRAREVVAALVDPRRRRVERGLPLSRRRPGVGLRRRRRDGSTASPSRASSPTRSACRRASAMR